MPSLREVGEAEMLRRLILARDGAAVATPIAGDPGGQPGVVVDAGDDAAVLAPAPGRDLVVTTDAFVEGVHYRPEWLSGTGLGARLAAVNLSDLAAMAATPRWALLSIGARPGDDADALLDVQRGLARALARFGARVVGGNLTAVDGPVWWSVTLGGEVARDAAWTRRGARPGDALVVTGSPGRAGAAVALMSSRSPESRADPARPLFDAWASPQPRVALALALAPLGMVRAAIDISDGFGLDLDRLCAASGVGARVDESAWPADTALEHAAAALGVAAWALRLAPSDDYELLLAVAPEGVARCREVADRTGVPLTVVGEATARPGERLRRAADGAEVPWAPVGFDHFAR